MTAQGNSLQSQNSSYFYQTTFSYKAAVEKKSPVQPVEGYRVGSVMSDSMAETLFKQDPPLSRHIAERKLRQMVREYWDVLREQERAGEIAQTIVTQKLRQLDAWLDGRLSGSNVLALARDAEEFYPEWIAIMPRLLAKRYEELRVARIWSALLNPEALSRLRMAIEMENSIDDEGGAL